MPMKAAAGSLSPSSKINSSCSVTIGHTGFEFLEPHRSLGIGGRAPVAAWRQRAARRNLRAVGQCGSLELAQFEEAIEEHPQPALDLGQRISTLRRFRRIGGPSAVSRIMPGVPGQIGDLRGAEAVPRRVVKVEVLQRIWPDDALSRLDCAI